MQIILDKGVDSITHREVASVAGVPLGSMTYYFEGLADLLVQAFELLSKRMAESFNDRFNAAQSRDEAIEAFTDIICGYPGDDILHGLLEFYSYGHQNAAAMTICQDWLRSTRATLLRYFPEETTGALDALLEGWHIHQSFTGSSASRELVLLAVRGIIEQAQK